MRTLQGLLRRQSRTSPEAVDSRYSQIGPKLVAINLRTTNRVHKTKIKTMLARVFAVDPPEKLLLLLGARDGAAGLYRFRERSTH